MAKNGKNDESLILTIGRGRRPSLFRKKVSMKISIKLSRNHPAGKMNLGKHVITNEARVIELEKHEEKILGTDEAKHWFKVGDVDDDLGDILDTKNKGGRPPKNR